MLVEELTVLLLLLSNTAVTLTVQLLPALREVMVWVVAVPSTVLNDDMYSESPTAVQQYPLTPSGGDPLVACRIQSPRCT